MLMKNCRLNQYNQNYFLKFKNNIKQGFEDLKSFLYNYGSFGI